MYRLLHGLTLSADGFCAQAYWQSCYSRLCRGVWEANQQNSQSMSWAEA